MTLRIATICLTLLLAACAATPRRDDALYRALGAREGIARVVDSSLLWLLADARINQLFTATDPVQLAPLLVDQICEASGGPCTYTGRTMEAAHAGLDISEEQFSVFVEGLIAGMNEQQVPAGTQATLLKALGEMKGQIVGR